MDKKTIINGTFAGILLSTTPFASAMPMAPVDTLVSGGITLYEYNNGPTGHYSIINNSQNDIFGFAVSSGFQRESAFINENIPSVYLDGWNADQITRDTWGDSALGNLGLFNNFFGEAEGEDFVSYYYYDALQAQENINTSNRQRTDAWQSRLDDLEMEVSELHQQLNAHQPQPQPPLSSLYTLMLEQSQATALNDYLGVLLTNPQLLPPSLPPFETVALPGTDLGPLPLIEFPGVTEILIAYIQRVEPLYTDLNNHPLFQGLLINEDFQGLISQYSPFYFQEERDRLLAEIDAKGLEINQHRQNQPESFILNAEDYAIAAGTSVGDAMSSPFSLNNFIPASAFIAFSQPSSGGQAGSILAQSFTPTAVPEPTTVAIFGLALTGLALTRRKKVS
jgi:hypothetical protein